MLSDPDLLGLTPFWNKVYAEGHNYLNVDPQLLGYNFCQFASKFIFKGSKLQQGEKTVIVRTYPNDLPNPNNEHYGLFCKYQLLKYKPWQCTSGDAWDNLEQSDETYTICWKQFLSTNTAKSFVPDWETKMQALNSYIYITPWNNDSLEEENYVDNEREERMFMTESNIQATDFCEQATLVPQTYWHQVY